MRPTISICMPTYNYARYLPEAIESVLKQSFSDFEFLIIDDCSTDASREVVSGYASRDKRIVFVANERNIGMVNNWNRCLQMAKGGYVKFLFGDDCLVSRDALQAMVLTMKSDDDIALVSSARRVIDERSCIIKTLCKYRGKSVVCEGTRIIKDCLLEQRNCIGEPSAVMFKKKLVERGFDGRYKQFVDLEMWFHLLEQGKFAYLNEPLCAFRVHPLQETSSNMSQNIHLDERFLLVRDYADKPYIQASWGEKEFMFYGPAYTAWKLYRRHGKLSRDEAVKRITTYLPSGIGKFFLYLPFYRLYKAYQSMKRRLTIFAFRRLIV